MSIDFQVIIDCVVQMFIIAFPFSLILTLVAKVTNIFCSFVFGKREVRL